jgi:hypothetical protein
MAQNYHFIYLMQNSHKGVLASPGTSLVIHYRLIN